MISSTLCPNMIICRMSRKNKSNRRKNTVLGHNSEYCLAGPLWRWHVSVPPWSKVCVQGKRQSLTNQLLPVLWGWVEGLLLAGSHVQFGLLARFYIQVGLLCGFLDQAKLLAVLFGQMWPLARLCSHIYSGEVLGYDPLQGSAFMISLLGRAMSWAVITPG